MDDKDLRLEVTLKPGTVFLGDGGVEKWLSVRNGYTFIQSTAASKPQLQVDGLYFDGGDSMDCSISLFPTDFTIEYWYNTANTVGAASGPFIASGSGQFLGLMMGYLGNTYYMSSNGSSWNLASGRTMGTIVINTWHHIAFVRSGLNYMLYNNGTLADTFSSATVPLAATLLRIGGYFGNFGVGKLADLRFYNMAKYLANFTPPPRSQCALSIPRVLPLFTPTAALVNQFDSGD